MKAVSTELQRAVEALEVLSDVVVPALAAADRLALAESTSDALQGVIVTLRMLDSTLASQAERNAAPAAPGAAESALDAGARVPVLLPRTVVRQLVHDFKWLAESPSA